ncbi:tyrosine-type recombinase/integrase [Facklamia sp. P13069]|uniref:tyrosine-type recombinase/integrase n=1 Tax=Facklamia sp. P13069 TaxID=3421954 RepID=UPI003D16456A
MYTGYYGTDKTGKKIITKKRGFKSRKEAELAEARFRVSIEEGNITPNKKISFKDFYNEMWLPSYIDGQTTSAAIPPSLATINNTKLVFKGHILPMFGKYKIDYLNDNKRLVTDLMTSKAKEYANFKALRGYFLSVMNWAEEHDYIQSNKLNSSLKRIKSIKKIELDNSKADEAKFLSQEQLRTWLTTLREDYEEGILETKDYALFLTTFFLSDRKSETYALQWKHIDFEQMQVSIVQALDKYGNVKATKGRKKTTFNIPQELMILLRQWKNEQRIFLSRFNIIQSPEQFVFTYADTKGNINKRLHIDYLNYRMNRHNDRHPELVHATPHKLRHTGATLAKQAGMSLESISEALTHSDTSITKAYVNSSNVIPMAVGEIAYRNLQE